MNDIYCPYCGAPMDFKIIEIASNTFAYTCPTCKARSPETVGLAQEVTIRLARKRMPTCARLITAEELNEGTYLPTVIWVEKRGREPVAGVWQLDHYEMEDCSTIDDLASELGDLPGTYNIAWRVWDGRPDKADRLEADWDD